jgi:hypothetical protein
MHSSRSPRASTERWRVPGLQGTDSYSPWKAGGEDSACNELYDSNGGHQELLGKLLLAPQGVPAKTMTFEELVPVLDKCKYMTSSSVKNSRKNNVTTFRYLQRFGVMDSITILRGCSNWPYVQKNMFPSQGSNSDKVFLFKMSEVGPCSGVDLVKQMHLGGNLHDAWIMFNHVKRVKKWTTMACHIYDSTYYRVMTIAICNM